MDSASFDKLATSFAASRRRVLGGLAALVAGAAGAVPAAAKKGGKGKKNTVQSQGVGTYGRHGSS